ncbi:hypothetical protein TNCV_3399511 [Trichonephila clavipes]|nr:hypothetical protein TNCV_3399511 [Trichonephila clavipes]
MANNQSVRRHLDAFTQGQIIGKLEEGRSVTNESRFSLSSDSHRILIWREREAAIIPRTSLKGTGMEVAVFSFGEASCLVVDYEDVTW